MPDDFEEFFEKVGNQHKPRDKRSGYAYREKCRVCQTDTQVTMRLHFDPPIPCDDTAAGECVSHLRSHCTKCGRSFTIHVSKTGVGEAWSDK